MQNNIEAFDKNYQDACFYAWYSAGCPRDLIKFVPPDKDGRKPSTPTILRWKNEFNWRQRADLLDAQASIEIDKQIIEQKKQDYKELAEHGRTILRNAMEYLDENGFDSAASAVRAIGLGADMVAKYSRAADMVDSVLNKTDKQITKDIMMLLGQVDDEVDGEVDADAEEDNN